MLSSQSTCKSPNTCPCCQAAFTQLECVYQETLDEINIYRKLLRLPPKTGLASSSPLSQSQIARRSNALSLQIVPPEVLDRIVCFIDSETILPFCHAIPSYKHISKAIYDVGTAFPGYYDGPTLLWPNFEFPCGSLEKNETETNSDDGFSDVYDYEDEHIPTDIPMRHILKIYSLTKLLTRYGGSATIVPSSLEYLDNILPLLPKTVYVQENPQEYPFEGDSFSAYLEKLGEAKSYIKMLHIPRVFEGYDDHEEMEQIAEALLKLELGGLAFSTAIPDEIVDVLQKFPLLAEIHVGSVQGFPVEVLPLCKNLSSLMFLDVEVTDRELLMALIACLSECATLREIVFQSISFGEDVLALLNETDLLGSVGWKHSPLDADDLSLGVSWTRFS
ncbi:hypothetical protein BDR26DRAFT_869974, partial [Obelidium mucronatum]